MDYVATEAIDRRFRRLGAAGLARLAREVRADGVRRSFYWHPREGRRKYVPLALKPWIMTPAQKRVLRDLALRTTAASLKVLPMWFARPEVRALLPFMEGERRWLHDAYRGRFRRPETLFGRADLAMDLGRPDWRERLRVIEVNLVGIGAAYYATCASQIAFERLAPVLDGMRLAPQDDVLDMIAEACRSHGRKIGRPDPVVALVEHRILLGPHEYQTMSGLYRRRGFRTVVADPTEVRLRRGELYCGSTRVDLLYRDPTLEELVDLEEEGADVRAVRFAFRENRVVSSLAGEVDHKGLMELLPLLDRRLDPFLAWTRVLRGTRTADPKGRDVDLFAFARRERGRLVVKPNRDYGGHGVTLGRETSRSRWEAVLDEAMANPGAFVVQERLVLPREAHPAVLRGRARFRRRHIVGGVHAFGRRCALLARASEEPVVNITRGGSVIGVLQVRDWVRRKPQRHKSW